MEITRNPHAPQNLDSRKLKGLKIERLLNLEQRSEPIRLLEIGTGSGGISHYFATHPELTIEVDSVDVCDVRTIHEGYRFQQVDGTRLPFETESFDVVLTNHVIEHVGDVEAQLDHLQEVRRVLKHGGTGYLAVPNRWMLVEPHYKLIFLSWLPKSWRSPYLKWRRNVDFYDCEPLMQGELERMLIRSGLAADNLCIKALKEIIEIEQLRQLLPRLLVKMPDSFLHFLTPVIPTLIYRLRRA